MQAWWSGNAAELLANEAEAIVRRLALRLVETHHLNRDTQLHAWRQQIALLRTALRGLPDTWRVLFEYPLLRLGRRIDTVLLTEAAILVLEFKVGATAISVLDRQQTEDYALDLFDFHAESRAHPVVPILVATQSRVPAVQWPLLWHGVTPVFVASAATLGYCCKTSRHAFPVPVPTRSICAWEVAPYRPVPTIVEAATMPYSIAMASVTSPRRAPMWVILAGPRPPSDRGSMRLAAPRGRGAVRHRHTRRRENTVWPECGIRRGDRRRVPDRQSAPGARDARSAGA